MPTATPQDIPIQPVNKPIRCSLEAQPTEQRGHDHTHRQAAVKVIGPRGHEVLAVHRLDGKGQY